MVDRDVVLAKVDAIDRRLARIANVRERRERMTVEDYDDLIGINLQRAAQDAIDLASHVVASEGWGVVDRVADHFGVLEARGVIDKPLAGRIRAMVGFRNVAVHQYTAVDPLIVERILSEHLENLRSLARAVLKLVIR